MGLVFPNAKLPEKQTAVTTVSRGYPLGAINAKFEHMMQLNGLLRDGCEFGGLYDMHSQKRFHHLCFRIISYKIKIHLQIVPVLSPRHRIWDRRIACSLCKIFQIVRAVSKLEQMGIISVFSDLL
jgi:hypothetical protein